MSTNLQSLTQSRAPLTDEDRAHLASVTRGGKMVANAVSVFAVVGMLASSSFGWTGLVFAVPLAGVFALSRWLHGRTEAMGAATDKLVYTGTVTGKRVAVEFVGGSGGNHAPSEHKKHLLALDGVELEVPEAMHRALEAGQRVELHCFREGSPFRFVRA